MLLSPERPRPVSVRMPSSINYSLFVRFDQRLVAFGVGTDDHIYGAEVIPSLGGDDEPVVDVAVDDGNEAVVWQQGGSWCRYDDATGHTSSLAAGLGETASPGANNRWTGVNGHGNPRGGGHENCALAAMRTAR